MRVGIELSCTLCEQILGRDEDEVEQGLERNITIIMEILYNIGFHSIRVSEIFSLLSLSIPFESSIISAFSAALPVIMLTVSSPSNNLVEQRLICVVKMQRMTYAAVSSRLSC